MEKTKTKDLSFNDLFLDIIKEDIIREIGEQEQTGLEPNQNAQSVSQPPVSSVQQPPKPAEKVDNTSIPQITTSEIQDWENKFKQKVYYNVQFGKDNDQGTPSMKLYKGESGIEAEWNGKIVLPENSFINWSFSLINGLFVNANMELEGDNRDVFTKLSDFYKEWKEEW